MRKAYFTVDENFEKIIKETLKDKEVISSKMIDTGWTNIVYEVSTNKGDFFFRFPRNDFWVKAIKKDVKFTGFIENKTNYKTVKLDLHYCDESRPFSVHKKIPGNTLADKIDSLTDYELKTVAKEIAGFMYELHHVKIEDESNLNELSDFLDELVGTFFKKEDKVFWEKDNFTSLKKSCYVHGDLNLSNILLDENNHLTAIIDFGFAGFGDKYSDIARVLSRECPKTYKEEVIHQYELLDNCTLDKDILDDKIDTWKKIDQGYINYMEENGVE